MKTVFTFALSFFCFFSKAQTTHGGEDFFTSMNNKKNAAMGKPLPLFNAMLKDSAVTNTNWLGKTVYLNFWFEGCAPCLAEFEVLEKMYTQLKDSGDFVFASFTFESPEKIEELKTKHKFRFPCLTVSRENCQRLNFGMGYPTHIILNKKGLVSYIDNGGSTDKRIAERMIMENLYRAVLKALKP